jgi:hypothetical protein
LVLVEAGLGSFDALGASSAPALEKAYAKIRGKHPEWGAPPVDEALASQWIRAARQYLGLPESPLAG